MAALNITIAEMRRDDDGPHELGRTFEALNAGQAVYYDADRRAWGKASAVSTLLASGVDTKLGLALSSALQANASIEIQREGNVVLGASANVGVGTIYILGAVAGSIYPTSDVKITHGRTILGVGAPAGVLRFSPYASGIFPASVLNDSLYKWCFAGQVTDNTPFVSPILDRLGYEEVTFFLMTGTIADADVTFTVLLEHGDAANFSDAAAVPDGEMVSQASGAPETDAAFNFGDDNEVRKLGYKSTAPKRYLRLTVTPAANAAECPAPAQQQTQKKKHVSASRP